jgi:hypothetical protein
VEEVKTPSGYQAVKTSRDRDCSFNRDRLMVMNYIPILAVMHERTCMDEVGMFDEHLGTHEDWDLFIRLANRYRFVHVPAVTADVSVRSDGSSTTSGNRSDFVRTLKVIHARYHHLVAHRADILAAQKRVMVSGITEPQVEVRPSSPPNCKPPSSGSTTSRRAWPPAWQLDPRKAKHCDHAYACRNDDAE